MKTEYESKLEILSKQVQKNNQYVYEAITDIRAGDYVTKEQLEYKRVFSSQSQNHFMKAEDIGKVALVNIPKGVYVQENMIANMQESNGLRETDYQCIKVAGYIKENDMVDVRIFYPNGENYIVLSKKEVKKCSEDHISCNLWLSEEEILRLSTAIVDAYLYSGAYLYCTKYINPTIQESSIVNYQPSEATQNLIHNNPNIVEVAQSTLSMKLRKELEERLVEHRKQENEFDLNGQVLQENTGKQQDYFYYSNNNEKKEGE